MQSLRRLYVHDNFMTGRLPSEIGLLSTLEELDVSRNALSGSLPTEIGLLPSLHFLDVSGNFLSGLVPREVCDLRPDPLRHLVVPCIMESVPDCSFLCQN